MKTARNAAARPRVHPVNQAQSPPGRKPANAVLTTSQIQLLRQSFALVEPQAALAGLIFYRNLFTLDPSLSSLFHTSIELQGRKLMEALSYTVATLEDPAQLAPVLEALGRRHISYGTRDEHYATVITALLQTLGQTLRGEFTPEVREAWSQALTFVADAMKRGAAPTAALKQSMAGAS